jgi:hypothetical protein
MGSRSIRRDGIAEALPSSTTPKTPIFIPRAERSSCRLVPKLPFLRGNRRWRTLLACAALTHLDVESRNEARVVHAETHALLSVAAICGYAKHRHPRPPQGSPDLRQGASRRIGTGMDSMISHPI